MEIEFHCKGIKSSTIIIKRISIHSMFIILFINSNKIELVTRLIFLEYLKKY